MRSLVASAKASALQHEQQAQELQRQLATAVAEATALKRQLEERTEREAMHAQQLTSLKQALRSMAEEKDAAFGRIAGDGRWQRGAAIWPSMGVM